MKNLPLTIAALGLAALMGVNASRGQGVKKVTFDVMGKKWTLRVMSADKYSKNNGTDSDGITFSDKRRIDLRSPDGLEVETIRHELVHAYLAETCTGSADLDRYDFEEVAAEMFAQRGPEIIKQADKIREEIE